MALSRRTFVVAGGALGLTGPMLSSPASKADETAEPQPTLDLITTTSVVFDPTLSTAQSYVEVLGVVVTASRELTSRARLEVDYDSRVSSATADSAAVTRGTSVLRRPTVEQDDDSLGTMALDLHGLGSNKTSEVTVALPLSRHVRYPTDTVREPRPTRLRLVDSEDGSLLASATAEPNSAPVAGEVWGATVAVVWDHVSVAMPSRDSDYAYPAFIRVDSVGPTAIPQGTRIRLELDQQIISRCSVRAFRGDETEDGATVHLTEAVENGTQVVNATLHDSIEALDSLSLAVTVSPSKHAPTGGDVVYAKASIEGPEPSSPFQRVTGAETAVAVTTSGAPRSATAFTGTV